MTKQITYVDLESALQDLDVRINVAEVHGLMTGMLCVSEPKDAKVWKTSMQDLLDCDTIDSAQWSIFTKIKNRILRDFQKSTFGFMLFLPDDEVELTTRLESLAEWCGGFVSGLALVGLSAEDLQNVEVKELVADLTQIAQLSSQNDASEEDEKNYTEVVEFVRIAVENIYLELQAGKTQTRLH